MTITREELTKWLLDNPKEADLVREFLCPKGTILDKAGRLLLSEPAGTLTEMVRRHSTSPLKVFLLKQELERYIYEDILDGIEGPDRALGLNGS